MEAEPLLLRDPSYDADPETNRILLFASPPDGEGIAVAFPAEEAGQHLHGLLGALQGIAERAGTVGLGAVAEEMIVLQPTELAMAALGPGRAAIVFAFGPVKLGFMVPIEQLASLLEETRKQM